MEVWIDPETSVIKAVYRGCTTRSEVWRDRGYVRYPGFEGWMVRDVCPSIPEFAESEIRLTDDDGLIRSIVVENDRVMVQGVVEEYIPTVLWDTEGEAWYIREGRLQRILEEERSLLDRVLGR